MTVWVVIPVKPPGEAKTRLAQVLGLDQRARLAQSMLQHVYSAAKGASGDLRIALLGPSRLGLPAQICLLDDPGGGLNAAVASALAEITAQRAERMVVLFADLPHLTSGEVARLTNMTGSVVGIAPDRHGSGTNALSLPLPAAARFGFAFGRDSFARHCAETERLGLKAEIIDSPGLASDIDVPGDLSDAAHLSGKLGHA